MNERTDGRKREGVNEGRKDWRRREGGRDDLSLLNKDVHGNLIKSIYKLKNYRVTKIVYQGSLVLFEMLNSRTAIQTVSRSAGQPRLKEQLKLHKKDQTFSSSIMPRGRKRKNQAFVPQPWIHNSSSEGEPHEEPAARANVQEDGIVRDVVENPDFVGKKKYFITLFFIYAKSLLNDITIFDGL